MQDEGADEVSLRGGLRSGFFRLKSARRLRRSIFLDEN